MRVIAIDRGYYVYIREPGDEFEVAEKSVASWFRPVEDVPAKTPTERKLRTPMVKKQGEESLV